MANTTDGRSNNKPSHEAAVKGGQHSHSNQYTASASSGQSGQSSNTGRGGNQPPSREEAAKGGRH